MSELWGIPEIKHHHWFPSNEGYSDIIRSIQSFDDDRITTVPQDIPSPDTTDMKAIFGSMRLGRGRSGPYSVSEQSSTDFIVYDALAEAGCADGIPSGPPAYFKH